MLVILKPAVLKCYLISIIKKKAASVLLTLNSLSAILSAFIINVPIIVYLIVRIKTCLVKTTRWLLNVRRVPWRSRRSAPRPRLKRL